jgi:hypothetical protein
MSPSPSLAALHAGAPGRSPEGTAMLAALSRSHIANAGRLGELKSDTNSPCGLLVPTTGQGPLALGSPALGPQTIEMAHGQP